MKKQLKTGLLLASAFLLVACGQTNKEDTTDTTDSGVDSTETLESTPESEEGDTEETKNYVYATEGYEVASDAQVKQFKDFLKSQSEEGNRQVTQTTVLQIPSDSLQEEEGDMVKEFGTETDEGYDVRSAYTVKTMVDGKEEVYSEVLQFGEANLNEHVKKIDGTIYTSIDELSTFAESLTLDTENIKQMTEGLIEDGLEGRIAEFNKVYGGKWVSEDVDDELRLGETYVNYFKGLLDYLEETVESEQYKVNDNKLYVEFDTNYAQDLESALSEAGGLIDVLFLDNGTSYIIEFDLGNNDFSVYRPDVESDRQIKATLNVTTEGVEVKTPEESTLVKDIEKFTQDYDDMLGYIIPEVESEDEVTVEGPVATESEADTE